MYDFTEELKTKEEEIKNIKAMVKQKVPPARGFEDVPQSKTSPNMKLGMECSYCEFKRVCWPGLKLFTYSHGPVYLTKVKKELRVDESDDWT